MITAWRIVKARRADTAFDGEGARLGGGRFNSPGTPVVYTSDSLALALLEVMVHLPGYQHLYDRVYMPVSFDTARVEVLEEADLPPEWRLRPAPRSTQLLGDEWVQQARSLVLRVPSVILPGGYNYLLNPRHPDFQRITIGQAQALPVDPRPVKG